jgi:hypothetical protein
MTEPIVYTDDIYERVTDFIKQIHEKDIMLNEKAKNTIVERTEGKDFWGKPIKKSYSVADIIGEQMSHYMEILSTEKSTIDFYQKKEKSEGQLKTDSFLFKLDMMSAIKRQKDDIALRLFENIESAYINGLIDEIGLGKRLKELEQQVATKDRLIASLEKCNRELKTTNDQLRRYIPNFKGGKTTVEGLNKK